MQRKCPASQGIVVTCSNRNASIPDLTRRNTPKRGLWGPSLVAASRQTTPLRIAIAQTGHDAKLEHRRDRAVRVRPCLELQHVCFDNHGAHTGQKGVMHPAPRAVTVFDPTPVAMFPRHDQRHVAALVDPVDPVRQRRTPAHIALGGLHRDKPGDRKIGDCTPVFGGPKLACTDKRQNKGRAPGSDGIHGHVLPDFSRRVLVPRPVLTHSNAQGVCQERSGSS